MKLKPVLLNAPSAATLFAWFNVVLPTALPLSVPAVMTPPPWLMLPAETSATVEPRRFFDNARLPAEVSATVSPTRSALTTNAPPVVSRSISPALPVVVNGPFTVNACALVRLKFAALKLPSVPILLARLSVVLPTELPVNVPAVMMPAP